MTAEGSLQQAAQLLPALAPIVDGVVTQLRAQAGRALAQSVQPSAAAGAASPLAAAAPMMGA